MKIEYTESTHTIIIDDKESNQLMGLTFSFSITFLMGFVSLLDFNSGDIDTSTYLRFALSGISVPFLVLLIFKKTGRSQFRKEEIQCLRERVSFGRSSFSFKLKNGKTRVLKGLRGKTKIDALLALCEKIGIPKTYKEII